MNNVVNSKPSILRLYKSECHVELLKVIRQPGFTIPSLVFPVMFYLFFGVFFSSNANMPSYMLATYGTFGVIGPGLFSFGVGIASERSRGWYALKEVSPMPYSASILSRIYVSLVFSAIIIVLLFSVAAILGGVTLYMWQWFSMVSILLVGTLPFCLLGLTFGLILSSNAAPAVINLVYLPMAFLSGLWMPIDLLPEWLQTLAWILPAYHLSQLTLGVLDMSQGHHVVLHLAYLMCFCAVFAGLAKAAFARKQ